MASIEKMLNPRSVAVIGASESEGSIGQSLTKNLLTGKDRRKIYPVNLNRETVMGLKCYPSVSKIPEHVDLAVIATPARTVPAIVAECAKLGWTAQLSISRFPRSRGGRGQARRRD